MLDPGRQRVVGKDIESPFVKLKNRFEFYYYFILLHSCYLFTKSSLQLQLLALEMHHQAPDSLGRGFKHALHQNIIFPRLLSSFSEKK